MKKMAGILLIILAGLIVLAMRYSQAHGQTTDTPLGVTVISGCGPELTLVEKGDLTATVDYKTGDIPPGGKAVLSWGDGESEQLQPGTGSLSHSFSHGDDYTISIKIKDADGQLVCKCNVYVSWPKPPTATPAPTATPTEPPPSNPGNPHYYLYQPIVMMGPCADTWVGFCAPSPWKP